ncbi:MAG TPA: acyl-CoA desaturase, partial [Nocardioides sp.]|nr:acyl-CoA desaturase [Nocardioides sp.]
ELNRAIRAEGLLAPRPRYYAVLAGVILTGLALVVGGLVALHGSWWALLLAPAYAVVSAQLAFFSHDAAHRQIARDARTTAALCLISGDLLNGLGYGWWVAKHNAHHANPNDLDADPDVAVGAFVWDSDQARMRRGFAGFMTRNQAALFFPLLAAEAVNLYVSSLRAVLRPGVRYRRTELVLLVGHHLLYLALVLGTLSWGQALVFVVAHQALFGVYLGCSFAPSHKGMPSLAPEQTADPLLRQVLTARNVRGGPFVDLALGGLNLQIEHHLFPSMPRPNLRSAQPLVAAHCRLHGIPYAESSLLGCYRLALRHLREVGAPLRG